MTLAILGLVSTVLPFLLWLAKRRLRQAESPEVKSFQLQRAIEKEITNDDEVAANIRLNDSLTRWRMSKAAGDPNIKRPASQKDQSREGL